MKKTKAEICIAIGLLLLAAALCLIVYNLCDESHAEQSARQAVEHLKERIPSENTSELIPNEKEEIPDYILNSGMEIPDYILNSDMEMPEENENGINYIGILRIPSLDLELPVISQWSYTNLKIAPCRYSGSAYLDNMAIAAHNYKSHFGLLKNLSEGDKIFFTDMDGNRFNYKVVLVETLTPIAVDEIVDSGYDLSLFTCTLSGQARVTVRCSRVNH